MDTNTLKMMAKKIKLRAGTTIYRARMVTDELPWLQAYKCGDTDKTGLYFSDSYLLCLGMGPEYLSDMVLCTYVTTRPLILYRGKYSFRDINPERYFREDGSFICNVDLADSENINHYDPDMLPIYDGRDTVYSNLRNSGCLGEIFICDEDLQYLEFEGAETWSLDRIKASIKTLCPGIADKF